MENARYFSRSWALLTRDKGWIKPILVMSAAALVPVAGEFGINGYALEWARLTAWGVDAAPKQKNVDVSKCLTVGARAFVVSLGLSFALFAIYSLVSFAFAQIPGTIGTLISALVSLPLSVVMAIMNLVIMLAQLRSAIYEKIGAGYRIDRVFELIGKDAGGFMRVFLVSYVCSLVVAVVMIIFITTTILLLVPIIIGASGSRYDDSMVPAMITGMIVPMALGGVIFGYIISLLTNAVRLIVMTSLGLWLRQFDVPNWGRSEDPLPTGVGPQSAANQPKQPMAQQWQQQAQQPPAQSRMVAEQPMRQPVQQPAEREAEQTVAAQPVEREAGQPSAQQPVQSEAQQQSERLPESQQSTQPQDTAATQTLVGNTPTQWISPQVEPEDLYESMADAIRENDRVEGDD